MALTRTGRHLTRLLPKPPEPEVDYEEVFFNIMLGKFRGMLAKIRYSKGYPTAKELEDARNLLGWLKENYKD